MVRLDWVTPVPVAAVMPGSVVAKPFVLIVRPPPKDGAPAMLLLLIAPNRVLTPVIVDWVVVSNGEAAALSLSVPPAKFV